jgi:hypothetical protein
MSNSVKARTRIGIRVLTAVVLFAFMPLLGGCSSGNISAADIPFFETIDEVKAKSDYALLIRITSNAKEQTDEYGSSGLTSQVQILASTPHIDWKSGSVSVCNCSPLLEYYDFEKGQEYVVFAKLFPNNGIGLVSLEHGVFLVKEGVAQLNRFGNFGLDETTAQKLGIKTVEQ